MSARQRLSRSHLRWLLWVARDRVRNKANSLVHGHWWPLFVRGSTHERTVSMLVATIVTLIPEGEPKVTLKMIDGGKQ